MSQNRRDPVGAGLSFGLRLGLRKPQAIGPVVAVGPTADTTAITADDTTNTADSF